MDKRFWAAGAISLALLSGCASMADSADKISGTGQITESVDSFDNSRRLSMGPGFLFENADETMPSGIKLGAEWSDKNPEAVALVLSYPSSTSGNAVYVNFSGMDINIDGAITSLTTDGRTHHSDSGYNTVSRSIYTSSENHMTVPRALVQKMLAARSCKLKIHTSDGYVNADFTIARSTAGQAAAKPYLEQFMARLPAIK